MKKIGIIGAGISGLYIANLFKKTLNIKYQFLIKKTKKNKIKYFEANIYMNENKILLVKNNKFNFLKNLLIFPMNEIDKSKFNSSPKVKTKIKISNIDMNIVINKNKIKSTNRGVILNPKNIASEVIPSFTKKLFRVASSNVWKKLELSEQGYQDYT